MYFAPADADQPVRLVGWVAADVEAGSAADVTVQCDARMWRRWDTNAGRWDRIEGAGELLVARGLGDVRLRLPAGNIDLATSEIPSRAEALTS